MPKLLKIVPVLLFLLSCTSQQPYIASRTALETALPEREIIPADAGCSVCHRIFAERLIYKYYPVRISHKSHSQLGLQCTFCHRKASYSTETGDYLMPEGHGFEPAPFEKPEGDNNPCRVCHLYFSETGKKDKKIPAECRTCHRDHNKRPIYKRQQYRTNLVSNHKAHYNKGIQCIRCHPGFDLMEETTLNFIPKMDICTECHNPDANEKVVGHKGSEAVASEGERLFMQNCTICHGKDGKGDGPMVPYFRANLRPRDLTDGSHLSKRTDQQIYDVILRGGSELNLSERMPSWEGLLNEEEVILLVRYIRNISGTAPSGDPDINR